MDLEQHSGDLEEVIVIFASSTTFETLLSGKPPRDFWTRMQLTVEMGHPFLVGSDTDLEDVLEQYVRMFLHDILVRQGSETTKTILRLYKLDEGGVEKLLDSFLGNRLNPQDKIRPVSLRVSRAIAKPLHRMCRVRTPSIRVVRTISERVFWGLLAHGLLGVQERGVTDIRFGRDLQQLMEAIDKWCGEKVPALFLEAYS